ncbi:MAG: FAD-binding oxidoreductase [Candidatus Hydrothermarchaeales archaeon]
MLERLKGIVGDENFSDDKAELIAYSRDSSIFKERPLCVVTPGSRREIVEIVNFANEHKVPIIPRGAGTNPCGEVVGKAIILDLTKMDRIIEVDVDDMYVIVQPGVVLDDLNLQLKKEGFFFPPDPASSRVCTIGGMVANNSSGLHAVKYGTTKDYVLALEVVMADGSVIETGSRALKSASGYDITSLLVGSEGTLGIFTEITLKILPMPEYTETLVFGLKDLKGLEDVGPKLLKLRPSAFEIMDDICIEALTNRYNLDFKGSRIVVIIEFDGTHEGVKNNIKRTKELLDGNILAIDDIWDYRKKLVPSLIGYKDTVPIPITEDIGVPVAKVLEAIKKIKEIYGEHGFKVAIYGHGGDGNLHMRVFVEGAKAEEVTKAADSVYEYVLSIEGTITSEHGIGLLRAKYMGGEHGGAFEIMAGIKKAFDKNNIMNPGKMGFTY